MLRIRLCSEISELTGELYHRTSGECDSSLWSESTSAHSTERWFALWHGTPLGTDDYELQQILSSTNYVMFLGQQGGREHHVALSQLWHTHPLGNVVVVLCLLGQHVTRGRDIATSKNRLARRSNTDDNTSRHLTEDLLPSRK
jgi:hypothetical protein